MKLLKFLGERSPILYALVYFIITLLSTFLMYYCRIFELSTSIKDVELNSFFTSLYFSFITITTLGYGDILPANLATRVLVMFLSFSGVLLTGLFLNSLAYRISLLTQESDKKKFEIEKKQTDIKKFLDITPILFQNFGDFISITYCLISQQNQRKSSTDVEKVMNLDFKLNDFKDMYKPSLLRKYSFYKSSIEVFYPIHDRLNQNLEDFLKLGYLNFEKDLMDKVIRYLAVSNELDSREHILKIVENKNEQEMVVTLLTEAKEPFKITEIPNVKDSYIQLYFQVQLTITLIKEIEQCIHKVKA